MLMLLIRSEFAVGFRFCFCSQTEIQTYYMRQYATIFLLPVLLNDVRSSMAIDNRWQINILDSSSLSPVTNLRFNSILSQPSNQNFYWINISAVMNSRPEVSIAYSARTDVLDMSLYLLIFNDAALSTAAPTASDVAGRFNAAQVSGTVAFKIRRRPRDHRAGLEAFYIALDHVNFIGNYYYYYYYNGITLRHRVVYHLTIGCLGLLRCLNYSSSEWSERYIVQ